MTDKSFGTHAGTAVDRQQVMQDALEQAVDAEVFTSFEFESELDYEGIDAAVYTPEGLKTVALKSRSDAKRDLENIDLGLRDKGRSGKDSKEAQNFLDPRETIADLLVFSLFEDEEVAEVLVIDFETLKIEYFHGNVDVIGPIEHQAECDDGRSFFLNAEDIRNSSAVIYQQKNWE